MSLDIRRVQEKPFKKLDRPETDKRLLLVKKVSAELINRALRWLVLASAFLLPAWVWDFGSSVGVGRVFVATSLFGLILVLWLISVLWLGAPLSGRRPALTKIALVLALLALLSAIFGQDPKVSFGLATLPHVPLATTGVFGFLFFAFLINRSYPADYFKKLLKSFLIGSTALALFVSASFFFGGYEPLSWVVRDGWLFIGAINILILTNLAMLQSGARRALWTLALVPHFLFLFLWDQAAPWILVLAGSLLVVAFRSVYAKKLWRSDMVYPLQIAVLSALLLFVPIKVFTGNNAPAVATYSYQNIGQALKEERLQNLIFGLGGGQSGAVMARTNVAFFDPDPDAGAALFASEIKSNTQVPSSALTAYTASEFPAATELNNSFASILLELGALSALGWLVLIVTLLAMVARFYRQHWQSLKSERASAEVQFHASLGMAVALFIVALAFTPWSSVTALVFLLLAAAAAAFYSQGEVTPLRSVLSRRWEHFSPAARLWSRRLLGYLAIIVYLAVVVGGSRVVLAGREARSALSTDAPGVAFNHWEKAERLNPWNDIYRVKRAESRLATLGSATSLPEQKEIIESANATFAKIRRSSVNPIAHWLSARLYVSMETYVEGTLALARDSYLKALDLWGTNVALISELARLYRYRADGLVGNDISASGLNQEIQDRLKYALKLSGEYLPARLELAFVVEKISGIPAAVAELEPWEETSPEIRYHLGRLHFNDNELEIAEEKFLKVLKDVPSHSNAHYSLGVVYFRQGKYEESLKEFEKVLELNPNNEDVKLKIEEVKKKIK